MKKIMIGLLAVIMTMSICACGNDTNTSSKESKTESSVSASNSSSNKKELIKKEITVSIDIDGKKVVGIGDDKKDYYVFGAVFGNCEVVIPDTVTYIGDYAFTGAKGLVKLSGGENCKKIGEYAFMNCVNLAEVTFLDNVTDLADNAFAGCTKWESLHS